MISRRGSYRLDAARNIERCICAMLETRSTGHRRRPALKAAILIDKPLDTTIR